MNRVNVALFFMNLEAASLGGVCGRAKPTFSKFRGTLSTQMLHGMVHKMFINVLANFKRILGVGDKGKDMDHTCKYVHKHGPHTGVCIEFDMVFIIKILS